MRPGIVAGVALLLAAPAVHGLVVGSTSPFEAAVRLLAAVVAAIGADAVLRRLLPEPARESGPAAAGAVPHQRTGPPTARTLPEPVAERLPPPG